MDIRERLQKFRGQMERDAVDAYLLPISDSHLSEYVADHFRGVAWLSGFTGSAGTLAVTRDDAGLWTDGRYHIQAQKQLAGSGIRLFKAGEPGVPEPAEWLGSILSPGAAVGLDESIFSIRAVRRLEQAMAEKQIALKDRRDDLDRWWSDRPAMPQSPIFVHDIRYAGKSRKQKIMTVRAEMRRVGAGLFLLASLDDVAWLLNIRGGDLPHIPVAYAYAVVSLTEAWLCIDSRKVPPDVAAELETDGVQLREYTALPGFLRGTAGKSLLLDVDKVNARLYHCLPAGVPTIERPNMTARMKAVKNSVEIDNLRQSQTADGAAMVRFARWLQDAVATCGVTELSAGEKLNAIRRGNSLCRGPSFVPIVAYRDHGAMMHYRADRRTDYPLRNEGLLLIDSGGQYYGGTTDITRTFVLGAVSEAGRTDYTLVLKSLIALSTARFPYGTTGSDLDILAREVMWARGLDYKCGTGHGVGYFLSVHEGPHRIGRVRNDVALEEGMVVTNEPGIYREGRYGIRIENMMLVVKDRQTEYGQFMRFDTLTDCPIGTEAVRWDMLTDEEAGWITRFNRRAVSRIAPQLTDEESRWLTGKK